MNTDCDNTSTSGQWLLMVHELDKVPVINASWIGQDSHRVLSWTTQLLKKKKTQEDSLTH